MTVTNCATCPGAVSRNACNPERLQSVDVFLAKYNFDTNPVFEFSPSQELTNIMLDEYGLASKDVQPIFLCSRKRYLGLCSVSVVEVQINSEIL